MLELAYALAGAVLATAICLLAFRACGAKSRSALPSPCSFRPAESLPSMTNVKNRACDKRDELRRRLASEVDAICDKPLIVGQIMSGDVALAQPSTPLAEIAAIMGERRIRHVPVVDAQGKLLGLVSDRDVAVRQGETAKDIMTFKPVAISREATTADAVEIMLSRNISSLPVYDSEGICGILTSADAMLGLQCACDALRSKLPRSNGATCAGAC